MAVDAGSSQTADVVVIGGGIIGSSIALRLAQAKLKVCVLDRGEPGAEASSAAAGMLAPYGERVEPESFFELCLASHALYPKFVAEIEDIAAARVGYGREGALLLASKEEGTRELTQIEQSHAKLRLSYESLTPEEVRKRLPEVAPNIRAGLFIPQDHWVDNQRLTEAVIGAARSQGVSFFSKSPVRRFNTGKHRIESVNAGVGSAAPRATFSAEWFVLAAGCWSAELMRPLGVSQTMTPCRGQMIEFESPSELPFVVRCGHHYLVPRSNRRVLAGTTAEYVGFEKEVTGEGLRSILEGVSRIAPVVKEFRFRRAWAGLRPDTADHLPILGLGEFENLVFATGHFRNGILLAPITAQLIAELILTGSTSQSIEAYRPGRFASSSIGQSEP